MYKRVVLEIFIENSWHELGEVEILEAEIQAGYKAKGRFQYALTYVDRYGARMFSNGIHAASVRYPLTMGLYQEPAWPAFLLDILPTGAARENWLKRLQLTDGPTADFELLKRGAVNPPGNIRVQFEGPLFDETQKHPGFDYADVVNRGVDFIEYAENLGAIVSGTSGAQGVAPKFLLVQDEKEKWHGDGAISDNKIKKNWLVKFPRGKQTRDYQILKAEAQYYEVARDLGVKVKGPLIWDNDTLFIPRFDRDWDIDGNLVRYGLESLISAMGVSDFGVSKRHQDYIAVIRKFSSQPSVDIKEYVFRDFLNVVMGNTDNHGRNTAFIKKSDTQIELSPLFDFAPMVLDDAGIPRATKWVDETYQIPNFDAISSCLVENKMSKKEVDSFMKESFEKLQNLNELFARHKVDTDVASITTKKYDDFMKAFQLHVSR